MKSKLGLTLSLVFVFLLGAVSGAVGLYLYARQVKPAVFQVTQQKPGKILDQMATMLELDGQQKESLKAIFAQSRQRYQALNEQFKPQYKGLNEQYRPIWESIRDETNERIKQILRPDQKTKFEAFLKNVAAPPPSAWRRK
jgi:flagellar motility protein MotE (MotC chaperone)